MTFLQVFAIALAAMALLAASRLLLVRSGRAPGLDGKARLLFIGAFLIVPPLVIDALTRPFTATSGLHGPAVVGPYVVSLLAIVTVLWLAAVVVQLFVRGRARPLLLLALIGSEGDPEDVQFDPPLTPRLADGVALVDRTNAVFPRGHQFPREIGREGFRSDWDALDAATLTLEGHIADDLRLGVAVAWRAKNTAADARSRLNTLRRLAGDQGQAWASA